jgi:hypothetical protein
MTASPEWPLALSRTFSVTLPRSIVSSPWMPPFRATQRYALSVAAVFLVEDGRQKDAALAVIDDPVTIQERSRLGHGAGHGVRDLHRPATSAAAPSRSDGSEVAPPCGEPWKARLRRRDRA